MVERLAAIKQLVVEARYPMSPVVAIRAKDQLANVEVTWLIEALEQLLLIGDVDGDRD